MVDAGDRDTALSGVEHAHSEATPQPLLAQKDHLRAAAMTQPLAVYEQRVGRRVGGRRYCDRGPASLPIIIVLLLAAAH